METVLKTFISFITTNLDDLCIMAVLFAANGKNRHLQIHLGHFLGMAFLVSLSLFISLGAKFVLGEHIRLLGIVPVIMGIKYYMDASRRKESGSEEPAASSAGLVIGTALITAANGADNVAVYTSLFSSFAGNDIVLSLLLFAVLTMLLGILSEKLLDAGPVKVFINRYSRYFVPILLAAIGVMTLLGI